MSESNRRPDFVRIIPHGDNRERRVCRDCGFVDYENPRIIVGAVVTHGDRFLICKRAIEPRREFWTIPAGFMEIGETPEEGATREAYEEATAAIHIRELLAVYTIRHISQVQMLYWAELESETFAPGVESLEVDLVTWEQIPWSELAFPSVKWALEDFRSYREGKLALPSRRST